jgi:hypothetical protein
VQKQASSNRNILWPLLVILLGAALLLLALDVLPPAVQDLAGRAWPVGLVVVGVALALDQFRPVRFLAPLLGLVVGGLLLAGVISAAYTSRAGTELSDQTASFTEEVSADVQRLHVIITGLDNNVQLAPVVGEDRTISAEYAGSEDSVVTFDYDPGNDGTATFTLTETRAVDFPRLEAVGQGRITLELPATIPVVLDYRHEGGTSNLSLQGMSVAGLNVDLPAGDLLLGLPEDGLEQRGEIVVAGGDMTLFVPDDLGVQFTASGAQPQFADEGTYLLDPSTGQYIARRFDDFDEQTELNITVGGSLLVE